MSDTIRDIEFDKGVDIAFEINKNIYMGKQTIQLLLKDIRQTYLYDIDYKEFENKLQTIKIKYINKVSNTNRNLVNNSGISYIDFNYFEKSEQNRTAIIVFDYIKAYELIKQLDFRNINFKYGPHEDDNDINTLIIMPIIDNLDLSIYNSIIICEAEMDLISSYIVDNKKVKILSNETFNIHDSFNNYFIPSRDILVKLYSIISQKKEINSDVIILCSVLNLSLFEFFISVEILYDINLISYDFSEKDQIINIKLSEKINKQKKDLESAKISIAFKNYYQSN